MPLLYTGRTDIRSKLRWPCLVRKARQQITWWCRSYRKPGIARCQHAARRGLPSPGDKYKTTRGYSLQQVRLRFLDFLRRGVREALKQYGPINHGGNWLPTVDIRPMMKLGAEGVIVAIVAKCHIKGTVFISRHIIFLHEQVLSLQVSAFLALAKEYNYLDCYTKHKYEVPTVLLPWLFQYKISLKQSFAAMFERFDVDKLRLYCKQ